MPDAKPPASLAEALAALQAQMPPIGKHATGKVSGTSKAGNKYEYDYSYAPGEDITLVLYPLMGPLGLSYSAAPTMLDGRFVLQYKLLHTSGEVDGPYFYPLPDPDRYGPQDLGKAETYARRYSLNALVGLFPGGDDTDAGGMQEKPGSASKQGPKADTPPRQMPRTGTNAELRDQGRMDRRQKSDHEKLAADTVRREPGGQKAARGKLEVDPWETRPPEERENAPGTVNDLQLRAIWMLVKKQGIDDPGTAHAMAYTALGLRPGALMAADSETGEVRDTFKRLSHAQAAAFIRQLQDGGDADEPAR